MKGFLLLLVASEANAFTVTPRATVIRQQLPPTRSQELCLSINSVAPMAQSLFRSSGPVPLAPSIAINVILFTLAKSKLFSMLTPSGYFHAMALGVGLWTTLGWKGWTLCVMYLLLGNRVTKVRFAEKEARGLSEGRGGRRGPENVWGSAATGLACALVTLSPVSNRQLLLLGYVASLATKLADTFASEIGKAYGKTTFLITNLKRVEPGTEGAVSAEGTAAAVLGGFLLSMYGYAVGLIPGLGGVAVSTTAAFVATNAESFLGATLQDKPGLGWITNEVINFLNTLIGAGVAMTLGRLFLAM